MLRAHLNDLKRAAASRTSVIHALARVSQGSPVDDLVGSANDATTSYATTVLRDQQTSPQLERYDREIVAYVTEWEKTVATRIATELKHIANLHTKWTRYHRRVEQLKASAQRKKHSPKNRTNLEEKISWNESKLRTAKKDYRRNLVAVTLLTEEVTDRGWKDLVPLMIRLIDFDVHAAKTASSLLAQLNHVREEMVELGSRYEMDFEAIRSGRLRVLLEEDAADFVDPSDLQDLESTIASVEGRGNKKTVLSTTRAPFTPPCSEDSASQDGEKNDAAGRNDSGLDEKEQQKVKVNSVDDASCAVPGYPSSIYLVAEAGASPVDDETTLTGVQDLVSV